jgi:hypothetical protein
MNGIAPEPADRAVALILAAGPGDIRMPATPTCRECLDTGHVCEDHPSFPWEGIHGSSAFHAEHGGAGMPCPVCCDPVPANGTGSITDAFTPRHLR